jgi:hypothetical protein
MAEEATLAYIPPQIKFPPLSMDTNTAVGFQDSRGESIPPNLSKDWKINAFVIYLHPTPPMLQ